MTSPKTYLPRAAESLLNAYPGSFQKWLAFHVIEEFFSLKSTASKCAALPAWHGGTNFPLTANGGAGLCPSWRHLSGIGEPRVPDLPAGSDQSPQHYRVRPANPKTFLRSHIIHEDPPQVISISTVCPRPGRRAECNASRFRQRADTWPCSSPAAEEEAPLSDRQARR